MSAVTKSIKACAVTAVAVLVIGLVKLFLLTSFYIESPLFLFLTAVLIATGYGGWKQGLLASALSLLFADYFLINPQGFGWHYQYNAHVLLYAVDCFVILVAFGWVHRYKHKIQSANHIVKSHAMGELKFRTVYESNMIGMLFADTDGKIFEANDYFHRILGYDRKDFEANVHSWHQITPPSSHEASKAAHQQLKDIGIIAPFEKQYIRKDGSLVPVLVSASRIEGNTVVSIILDISERKKSEASLEEKVSERTRQLFETSEQNRQSRHFLDSVIENIPNMIFVKDAADLKFIRFNKAGEELLGYSRDELIGKSDYDFFPPEQAQFFVDKDREVLKRQTMVEISEEPIQTKSGTRFVRTKKIPLLGENGKAEYLLGISEDITAIKEAEKQKLELLQEQATSRAKSAFLANMSHEIRTPLGAMLGFADLILDSNNLTKEHTEYINTIIRNGKQLYKIVGEILDISKVESEAIEVELMDFSLTSLLKEVHSLLEMQAKAKNIELKVSNGSEVPKRIVSDPTKLRQILINVIGNAIKFTQQGSVEIDVQAVKVDQDPTKLLISFTIKDSGIGIKPEQTQKLFQPFVQADSSMTRKYGGTGLGLFLSKKLSNLLDGDLVLLSSAPSLGSVFQLTIQAREGVAQVAATFATKVTNSTTEVAQEYLGRVLIVDDVEENRALIKLYAKRFGFEVESASGGLEGVEKALARKYDVILMDLQMPDVDGFEAVHRLRENNYTGPIVAITAHAMKGDREMCLANGFDEYLCKPVDKELLRQNLLRYSNK